MRPGREKKRRRRILVVATGSPRQMRLVQRGTARQMIAAGMDHHQISDHLTTRRRENPFYSGDGRFDSRNIHYVLQHVGTFAVDRGHERPGRPIVLTPQSRLNETIVISTCWGGCRQTRTPVRWRCWAGCRQITRTGSAGLTWVRCSGGCNSGEASWQTSWSTQLPKPRFHAQAECRKWRWRRAIQSAEFSVTAMICQVISARTSPFRWIGA